jgi:hypothetical protein
LLGRKSYLFFLFGAAFFLEATLRFAGFFAALRFFALTIFSWYSLSVYGAAAHYASSASLLLIPK